MGIYGYARVSTVDQDTALQTDALTAAGCIRIWQDHANGSREERPELTRCLDYLRGRTGGRKPSLTPRQAELARTMYAEKGPDGKRAHTVADIARELKTGRSTIYRYLDAPPAPAVPA